MTLRSFSTLCVGCLLLAGCPDDEPAAGNDSAPEVTADVPASDPGTPDVAPDTPPPDPWSRVIAGWTVTMDPTTGAWRVTPEGGTQPVLRSAGGSGGLRVATGAPRVEMEFGAFKIDLDDGPTWYSLADAQPSLPVSETVAAPADGPEGYPTEQWVVSWPVDGLDGQASIAFGALRGRDLWIEVRCSAAGVEAAAIELVSPTDESFFGLGTQSFAMDLRGGTFPLWTQEQGIGKSESPSLWPAQNYREAAYAPMGVWHSSRGWSAIVGHDSFSELDLAESRGDRVILRSYRDLPSFALLAGADLRQRLAAMADYVGKPPEPPAWVFAPWNDAVGGPEHLAEVAAVLRENDIPSSAIWAEDWIGNFEILTGFMLSYTWSWDQTMYPDLPADIAALQQDGFAFLAYFNTFVPNTAPRYAEGDTQGYLIGHPDGGSYTFIDPGGRDTSLVDLTNPAAVTWLKEHLTTAADDLGVDGWMADFTEWMPADAELHSGVDAWRYHNRYPLDWQRANQEALAEVHASGSEAANNWTFFARSGWASVNGGTAGASATMWGGDQNTSWEYGDGLPTIIPIGAHVGLAGVPFFGTDVAGYTNIFTPPTTKELFLRWSSAAAFHPLMRTHHGSSECANWDFRRDAETLEHYRRYAVLHTLLYPYFRNLAAEALDIALPLIRHPYLVQPEARALWEGDDYLFFLGDDLLVAPVLAKGAVERVVELPGPGWWPLFGDSPLAGETPGQGDVVSITAAAAPTEVPVFVRPGTVLPLLWEPVDTFYGSDAPDVSDLDDVAGRYRLALYPSADGSLRATKAGVATVTGAGFGAGPIGWASATVDGSPVAACADAEPTVSCSTGEGLVLVGTSLVATIGEATLTIDSDSPGAYQVSVGGTAFGQWAEPTAVTELDPDIPPPCEM